MEGLSSIDKIKEAEETAAKLIEKSREEKNRIISEARAKSIEMMENVDKEMKKARDFALEQVSIEMEKKEREKIKAETESIEETKKATGKKMAKEVDFLYEKFMEIVSND